MRNQVASVTRIGRALIIVVTSHVDHIGAASDQVASILGARVGTSGVVAVLAGRITARLDIDTHARRGSAIVLSTCRANTSINRLASAKALASVAAQIAGGAQTLRKLGLANGQEGSLTKG